MSSPETGAKFRAPRSYRLIPCLFTGMTPAICLGIAVVALVGARGHADQGDVVTMIATLAGITAFSVWAGSLLSRTYRGTTTLRDDGLLFAKPRRAPIESAWRRARATSTG